MSQSLSLKQVQEFELFDPGMLFSGTRNVGIGNFLKSWQGGGSAHLRLARLNRNPSYAAQKVTPRPSSFILRAKNIRELSAVDGLGNSKIGKLS